MPLKTSRSKDIHFKAHPAKSCLIAKLQKSGFKNITSDENKHTKL